MYFLLETTFWEFTNRFCSIRVNIYRQQQQHPESHRKHSTFASQIASENPHFWSFFAVKIQIIWYLYLCHHYECWRKRNWKSTELSVSQGSSKEFFCLRYSSRSTTWEWIINSKSMGSNSSNGRSDVFNWYYSRFRQHPIKILRFRRSTLHRSRILLCN